MGNFRKIATMSFLLALFAGYFASITFFSHTHIVNGVNITHSHPYKPVVNDPQNPGHQHTDNEFLLLQLISSFTALLPEVLPVSGDKVFIADNHNVRLQSWSLSKTCSGLCPLRGPPMPLAA